MGRISGIFFAMAGLTAAGTSTSVMADNLLGVYVGVGVGEAQIRNNNDCYNPYGYGGRPLKEAHAGAPDVGHLEKRDRTRHS